jgi:hypothetical protein
MSDATPAPTPAAEPAAPTEPQSDSDGLGENGKAALKAERDRANTAEKTLKALQAQHETVTAKVADFEKFQQDTATQLAERDLAITRLNVGLEKGLPKELIDRLQGADEAALQADADALLKFVPAADHTAPRPDPSQGAKSPAGSTPEAQFAAFMGPLLNH